MFVGVVLRRCKTESIIREFYEIETTRGGPRRGIVEVANEVSGRYSCDWEINCMQLSEEEVTYMVLMIDTEKQMVERMTGIRFNKVDR